MQRLVWAVIVSQSVAGGAAAKEPNLVSVKKIWDRAPHSAFTDLIRFQGKWVCTFREGSGHVPGTDGTIRVLVSDDGEQWSSSAHLTEQGIDLRDPKISQTPDGRLMIVAGGSVYKAAEGRKGKTLVGRQPRVSFSADATHWSAPQRVLSEGEWLWRVTWHDGAAYGVTYDASKRGSNDDRSLVLYRSKDGVRYEKITDLDVPGFANETTLRFLSDGRMVAFIRREAQSKNAWIGTSAPPYTEWTFNETSGRVGGPNFIVLDGDELWGAGRYYSGGAKTAFGPIVQTDADPPRFDYRPVLKLPSGGDTSYPGLVWHDGMIWMSYYSSHEGKTSIYLAKIKLKAEG